MDKFLQWFLFVYKTDVLSEAQSAWPQPVEYTRKTQTQ